jgi:hypothetical protein
VPSAFDRYLTQFRDPYERKARLWPGLLVLVPIIIALAARFGSKHPVLSAASSIIASCGGMYAMASIVRGKGKELEENLVKAWGGMPTTIALRHRDNFLDSLSKERYHELITRKLGIAMPTADEERANPAKADDIYIGATRRLRELTRNDKGLLFKENIAFGFHRNMLAMKPTGIVICLLSILYAVDQTGLMRLESPYIAPAKLDLPAGLTLSVASVFLAAWLFYFRRGAVRRIGFVYAERLFERLPTLRVVAATKNEGPK